MRAGGDVVVVGSLNVDIAASVERHPAPGETVLADSGVTSPGGKGANQAVAAALAGARVRMVGAVGDDVYAQLATSLLERAGVDVDAVRTVGDEPTGLALITVGADGENSIVVISGANAALEPADVETQAWSDRTVLVLQCEVPVRTLEAAAERVGAAAGRLVLNLAPVVDLPPDLMRQADPLVVNEHEAAAAAAMLGVEAEPTPQRIVAALADAGVSSVVCTLGGQGAIVADGDVADHLPAHEVEVVDTTGAGDAFVGTLAARLSDGDSLRDAAREANAVASRAVGRRGAQESYDWDIRP